MPDILFDGIVGRNALQHSSERQTVFKQLARHLAPKGRIVLAETIPFQTLRLYSLLKKQTLPAITLQRLQQAEDSLYTSDPDRYWNLDAIAGWVENTDLAAAVELLELPTELAVTPRLQTRWFDEDSRYMQHLAQTFATKELAVIQQAYKRDLGTTVSWKTHIALITLYRTEP